VTAQLRNSHPSLRNECVHVCVCIVRLGKLCGCGTIPTFEKVSKTSHISDWHDEKKTPPSNRSQQTCTHDGVSATFSFPFI
jgi:hypothetical protein